MPKITRIRIVNFQYNNEKRWILDELYDLSDDEGRSGVNTLIALMNGGGKTVLTHLILQPILPGAKVAKRRIEDFFTKASCHCFVLLEWQKDYSTEKLLTGIAMAASESSGQNENVRGKTMRYYTFYANYEDDRFPYSVVNLPLSRNESGRFVAAEYEYVRKAAEKSGGVLQCYSSEQNKDWKGKLEEYGIFQEIWRNLMEPLNSDENGMSQYFAKFKTSDRLIDNLLIPVIESRLGQRGDRDSVDNEDSSLATMLLRYVKDLETYGAGTLRNISSGCSVTTAECTGTLESLGRKSAHRPRFVRIFRRFTSGDFGAQSAETNAGRMFGGIERQTPPYRLGRSVGEFLYPAAGRGSLRGGAESRERPS